MRCQLREFGVTIEGGRAESITGGAEDGRWYVGAYRTWKVRYVVLATGVRDLLPPVPDASDLVRCGILRQCPICDGYEVADLPYGTRNRPLPPRPGGRWAFPNGGRFARLG